MTAGPVRVPLPHSASAHDRRPAPHLRNQVLMHPPQLGPLLPVLGDDCLLIEFVSEISILVIEHGAV